MQVCLWHGKCLGKVKIHADARSLSDSPMRLWGNFNELTRRQMDLGRTVIDQQEAPGSNGIDQMSHAVGGAFQPANDVECDHGIRLKARTGNHEITRNAPGLGQVSCDCCKGATRPIDHDQLVRRGECALNFQRLK